VRFAQDVGVMTMAVVAVVAVVKMMLVTFNEKVPPRFVYDAEACEIACVACDA
jgi:hypothetical protein